MLNLLIICAVVVLLAVISSKLLYRFSVPTLLIFMGLGMLFGSEGIVGIQFDNFEVARQMCSVGLIFIMFYGGFGTNWKAAKPVAVPSILMSTVGVVITAAITGVFCKFVLHTSLLEGLLVGAVLASTDAASVFAVLRSRKLNLKGGLASLLEIESGSNDPVAYMLTIILVSLINNDSSISIPALLASQILFGLLIGAVFAFVAAVVLRKVNLEIDGLYPIFALGVAVLGYALSETIGGNGYLCVYIIGIVLGNSKILHKRSMMHFFDGISWLMQIMLFFTLGLLSFPSHLPHVLVPGVLIAVFMIVVARPIATFSILSWFKYKLKEQIFVSWVGLRGAASIVFAIFAVTSGGLLHNDIFHIVFLVALLSVGIQGTFIPAVAKKLDLVEKDNSVFKTFNDYQDESSTQLLEYKVKEQSLWKDKTIMEANIPEEILVVMIRRGKEIIVPRGNTKILLGDTLVLSGNDIEEQFELVKHDVMKKHGK